MLGWKRWNWKRWRKLATMDLIKQYVEKSYPLNENDFSKGNEFVYLIYNPSSKLYKVGKTTNIEERLRQLKCQSGCFLELLGYIELEEDCDESSEYLERYIHKLFKSKRVLGEWFSLNIKDVLFLKALMFHIEGIDFFYVGMFDLD